MVPDELENFSSGLKPSASDVIPMIKMGKSSNESTKLSSIETITKAAEVLDLEKHHFDEDLKQLQNSYRKPSQSHFIPAHKPLSLEISKPDREVDRIVFNQDMVSKFGSHVD